MSRAISTTGRSPHLARYQHHTAARLPPVLRRFSREYPDVKLDIHFIDSEEAWEAVLHGDLEMGVVTLPPQPDPRLHSQAVWQDPLVFMAAPEHPLARLHRVTLETLTGYSAILPSPVTFTRRIVESLFEEQALTLNISMSTNYLETIHMMVSIGLGWSVLPKPCWMTGGAPERGHRPAGTPAYPPPAAAVQRRRRLDAQQRRLSSQRHTTSAATAAEAATRKLSGPSGLNTGRPAAPSAQPARNRGWSAPGPVGVLAEGVLHPAILAAWKPP